MSAAWVAAVNILLYLGLVAGCAGGIGHRGREPGTLIIRNNSGQAIESVTLSAPPRSKTGPVRHGSIAPVPLGASQVYVRPTSAPPLPATLQVQWVTASGQIHSRSVGLTQVLRSGQVKEEKALVFEISAGQQVNVYLENTMD